MIVSVSIGLWWHLRKVPTPFCRVKRELLEKVTTKLRTKGQVGVSKVGNDVAGEENVSV